MTAHHQAKAGLEVRTLPGRVVSETTYCSGYQTHFSPVIEPKRVVPAAYALSDSGGVAFAAAICAVTGHWQGKTGQGQRITPIQ
jgi:hypothetical protein